MELILLPIVVSMLGVGLFLIPTLVGGAMLLCQTTAHRGKLVLISSIFCLSCGLVCCWLGFAVMLLVWSWESLSVRLGNIVVSLPIAIFFLSGPLGILIGIFCSRRAIRGKRVHADGK